MQIAAHFTAEYTFVHRIKLYYIVIRLQLLNVSAFGNTVLAEEVCFQLIRTKLNNHTSQQLIFF